MRRSRNGVKKENLEQLYLVSGSFPDQTHRGGPANNTTLEWFVCCLPKGAKGWNIQPNSVLWEENGNASLPQVHHSRKNLEGWSATRSV